jgi:uncharacterized membrane protein YkvA (DUF1232 family)
MKPRLATPWGAIFSLFLGLFYGVSPIDIIPDLIPLLGLVDDAVIVPIMLILAFFQYRRVQKRNASAQTGNVIVMPPQAK